MAMALCDQRKWLANRRLEEMSVRHELFERARLALWRRYFDAKHRVPAWFVGFGWSH